MLPFAVGNCVFAPGSPPMPISSRSTSKLSWKIFLAGCGVVMVSLAAYNYLACYCSQPVRLTISGGNVCPLRSEMAKRICSEVASSGVLLEAVFDTTSEKISADVNERRLDLGLVLGGIPADAYPNVRQVATLGVEPLHLLVKRDLATGPLPSLLALRGRRVSLGQRGSNGALLAEELLRFAGLRVPTAREQGDFEAVYTNEDEMIAQLQTWQRAAAPVRTVLAERMPDAVFIVDSLPSALVDELVKTAGYQLVPLPYATALHLDNRRDHAHEGHRLESSRLEACVIPAYTYSIEPASPPQDCPTVGLRLLLVSHKNVPSHALIKFLRGLDQGLAQRYHVDLDAGNVNAEYPLHPGATAFAQGRRPFSLAQMLEPLTNFLSVLGAGAAGALAFWGFLRGLRAVSPDVHLRQIDRIERLLTGSELDETAPTLPLDFINFLEARLAQVKQAAIEDYAHGRLEHDEALVSILTLIADTRHLLIQRRKQLCQETKLPTRTSRFLDAA
jgi:TRAP-type uncharacterized transport system substrate-binding protein